MSTHHILAGRIQVSIQRTIHDRGINPTEIFNFMELYLINLPTQHISYNLQNYFAGESIDVKCLPLKQKGKCPWVRADFSKHLKGSQFQCSGHLYQLREQTTQFHNGKWLHLEITLDIKRRAALLKWRAMLKAIKAFNKCNFYERKRKFKRRVSKIPVILPLESSNPQIYKWIMSLPPLLINMPLPITHPPAQF